jgi:hypothetical protein
MRTYLSVLLHLICPVPNLNRLLQCNDFGGRVCNPERRITYCRLRIRDPADEPSLTIFYSLSR